MKKRNIKFVTLQYRVDVFVLYQNVNMLIQFLDDQNNHQNIKTLVKVSVHSSISFMHMHCFLRMY